MYSVHEGFTERFFSNENVSLFDSELIEFFFLFTQTRKRSSESRLRRINGARRFDSNAVKQASIVQSLNTIFNNKNAKQHCVVSP